MGSSSKKSKRKTKDRKRELEQEEEVKDNHHNDDDVEVGSEQQQQEQQQDTKNDEDDKQQQPEPTSISNVPPTKKKKKHKNDDDDDEDDDEKESRNNNNYRQMKRAQKAAEAADLEEEKRLTELLFGNVSGGGISTGAAKEQRHLKEKGYRSLSNDKKDDDDEAENQPLFQIDRQGNDAAAWDDEDDVDDQQKNKTKETIRKRSENFDDDDDDDEMDGAQQEASQTPAWKDEDDARVSVDITIGARLRKMRRSQSETKPLAGNEFESRLRTDYQQTTERIARIDWAHLRSNSSSSKNKKKLSRVGGGAEDDDDDDMMAPSSSEPWLLSKGSRGRLAPNIIELARAQDANAKDPSQSLVRSVHFHPSSDPDRPLLLTAGFDKSLRFFQVTEDGSDKVHGIHFPKMPIYSASFLGSTGNVLVTGRRSFFYIYDAAAGKLDHIPRIHGRNERSWETFTALPDGRTVAFVGNDGYIVLFDAQRKSWMFDLKMNGHVQAVAFTSDGKQLLSSGTDGDVYRWDLSTRRCIERFPNQDGGVTTYMACSDTHLAVGAESGVVNLYSEHDSETTKASADPTALSLTSRIRRREPIKSIMNLRTRVDMMRFNHDGQLMAVSSKHDKDQSSLKLVHVATATVFSNWPTSTTPLNYVSAVDFSPSSRFMAVGNAQGRCLLWSLAHYAT